MPPSAIGKRAGATVALECSFPKREPKNSDFARFYMSCVGRKIWGDAAPDAFPAIGKRTGAAVPLRKPCPCAGRQTRFCAQLFSYRVKSRGTFEQRQTWRLI